MAALSPEQLQTRLREAQQFGERGQMAQAEAAFRDILARQPGQPAACFGLSGVLWRLGRLPEAVEPMEPVVRAYPDDLQARLQYAQILRGLGRNDEAREQFRAAIRLNPEQPQVWNILGNICRDLGLPEESERSLRKAIELQPAMPEAWNNLGSLYSELGRAEEAIPYFRKAIKIRPEYFKAWRNLTLVRRFSERDEEFRSMQNLYERHADDDFAIMQLGFALGKACEDLGDHAEAFEYWRAGNRKQRKLMPYAVQPAVDEMRVVRKIFSPATLARADGAADPGRVPIFVVGMPRSGTSLTEQIIASHSAGFGAGERDDIRHLAWYAVDGQYPHALAGLGPAEWQALGRRYLERIGTLAGDARYVVDKMPRNAQHVGHIAMMLRDARIVHCRRDPLDIALSCYKTHFLVPELGFSNDLGDFGRYYLAQQALMDYWRSVLPDRIYELDYEVLVADPETQIRALLDWCDIPFEDACLQPHLQRRMVATASALQVREPIHTGAVRSWERYAQQLRPLRDRLMRAGD